MRSPERMGAQQGTDISHVNDPLERQQVGS
jgi:hypothetical protein